MASYTDAISTFNPYVSQIPVDAMVKVGMQKQAQYDQGVQKIQSYIDNVAGMEILNDTDKEYLHSKLNQLGSDLKVVAAGDFSNQQLVNSVGGMASQITKDTNIQNAIFSTSNAKKQQARIDADVKKGKLNDSSQYIYNKELQKYMGNKEVGQRFTGQYVPKTSEWDKKMFEAIKVLQPKITQQDIAYLTDPKTGKPDIKLAAEVMQRYTDKRVDEDQIRTAINAVLNPADLEQMRMDGIFNYRHYNEKDIAGLITEKTNENIEIANDRLGQLRRSLKVLTDPDKILAAQKLITLYENKLGDPAINKPGELRTSAEARIASLSDPDKLDQVKSETFLRNTIDEYSNAFAYAEIKNEIMTNPVVTERRAKEDDEFKRQVEASNQLDKAETRRLNRREDKRKEDAAAREQGKYEKEQTGDAPHFTGVGDETEQKRTSVINWLNNKRSYENQNRSLTNQIKDKVGGAFNNLTDAEIETKINEYAKDPVRNKPDDNSVKELMDSYLANKRYIAKQDIMLNEANKKATEEVTGGKGIISLIESDLSKMSNITLFKGGKPVVFTPKEIVEYLSTREYANVIRDSKGNLVATAGPTSSSLSVRDEKSGGLPLTEKEQLLKETLGYRYVGGSGGYEARKNPVLEKELSKYNALTAKYKGVVLQIADRKVELLQPYTGAFKTEGSGITFSGSDGKTAKNFIYKLRNAVSNDVRQQGGDINYDAKKTLENLAAKDADQLLSFGVERQGNKYYIQVQDQAGDFQNVPVSSSFIKNNLGANWLNKAADTQMQMHSLGGNSNPTNDINLSQYAPNDFGSYINGSKSVTLKVYADTRDQDNGNASVTFRLKNDRGESIPIVWPGVEGITSIDKFPQWLKAQSDATLLPLLKRLYPGVDEFLKR